MTLGVQTDPSTAKLLFAGIASHAALMAAAVTLVAVPSWMATGWSTAKMCAVLLAMVLTRPFGMLLIFQFVLHLKLKLLISRYGDRSCNW